MNTISPLRYPGGKSSMAGLLRSIIRQNRFGRRTLIEPFAGGAGASLSLLFGEEVPRIWVNDADRNIADFWWSVIHRTDQLVDLIINTPVSIAEWRRQRDLYRESVRLTRLRRGFAAFYLNRCNRSGIVMNGGPIGGVAQAGEWKIDARFNAPKLAARCRRIAEYSERITVSNEDGLSLVQRSDLDQSFFFIDPPYYGKGKTLYLNTLEHEYHARLADLLRRLTGTAWVLTYDDCPEIRQLYSGWAKIRPFGLRYAASERRSGKEVLIVPERVELPTKQRSRSLVW